MMRQSFHQLSLAGDLEQGLAADAAPHRMVPARQGLRPNYPVVTAGELRLKQDADFLPLKRAAQIHGHRGRLGTAAVGTAPFSGRFDDLHGAALADRRSAVSPLPPRVAIRDGAQ